MLVSLSGVWGRAPRAKAGEHSDAPVTPEEKTTGLKERLRLKNRLLTKEKRPSAINTGPSASPIEDT